MELQHINLKMPILQADKLHFEDFNPAFQIWIQQKLTPELLIDVANYLHVPQGPGMVLVGLEGDYSIDHSDGIWGLRYNRKAFVEGDNPARLRQALRALLEGAERLKMDERFLGKLEFKSDEIEFFINDRALAPNTPETFKVAEPALKAFFASVFGSCQLQHVSDPRERFTVKLRAPQALPLAELIRKL